MKKYLSIVCCLWMLTLAAAGQVNRYYVTPSGNNSNDGSQARPWKTINKAIGSFSLGAGGTEIHVAAGTYADITGTACQSSVACINRGGSSPTVRLKIVCDKPLQCFLTTSVFFWAVNNVDLQGFDITSGANGTIGIGEISRTTSTTGNSLHIIGNRIHDIGQDVTFNGILGCLDNGMIDVGAAHGLTSINHTDTQITGNILNNFGRVGNACNNAQGIYTANSGAIIQNNIVSNIATSGIQTYDRPCNQIISNNIVFHNGRGISLAGGTCTSGYNTLINNIIYDSVHNSGNGASGTGLLISSGGATCPAGTTRIANNIFNGNTTNISGAGTCDALSNSMSEEPTATFVNYQMSGSGDYHLKAGSVAIKAMTMTCVTGGPSPCVPAIDFDGLARSIPSSIGAYEFGTSSNLSPDAPTNLTATVQ